MYNALLLSVGVLVSQIWRISCWNLSDLGVQDDYYVNSIALHRSRAFLALPRSACSNKPTYPTLIETTWHGDVFNKFHNTRPKLIGFQDWNDCNGIQDAISVEMEPAKPKLWILDKGNGRCPAKMVSYSLIFNSIADSVELENVDGKSLNVMVVDKLEHRAYIGQVDGNVLLVFSLRKLIWWRLRLSDGFVPIQADFLAMSKTGSELFVTGKNGLDLFSLNLDEVRSLEEPLPIDAKDVLLDFNVTVRGQKLGISTGIETDYDSGLIYYLPRDYAVLRWDTRYPSTAEYHQVLHQSYEIFPYVSGFFTDIQDSTWAIANPDGYQECSREKTSLEKRAVRLLKFNKFLQEIEFENNSVEDDEDKENKRNNGGNYEEGELKNEKKINEIGKSYNNGEEKEMEVKDSQYEEIVSTPQTIEAKEENERIDEVDYIATENYELEGKIDEKPNNSNYNVKEELKNENKTKGKSKSLTNDEEKEMDVNDFEYEEIVSTPQTIEVKEGDERTEDVKYEAVKNDELKEEIYNEKLNNGDYYVKEELENENKTKDKGMNDEEKEIEVEDIENFEYDENVSIDNNRTDEIEYGAAENDQLKEKFDNEKRNNSDYYVKEELYNDNKTKAEGKAYNKDEEKEMEDIGNFEYEEIVSTPQTFEVTEETERIDETLENNNLNNTVTDKIDVQKTTTIAQESTGNNPMDFETLIDAVEGL